MNQVKRVEKWDILKFILIFLVVLGHVIESSFNGGQTQKVLFVLIYSFHMPVFVFISGLFSKNNINQKRYGKIAVFLFMYFITKFIIAIGRLIATGKLTVSMLSEKGLPWYMFAMFAFPLITMALKNFSPKYILAFSVFLSCIAGYDTNLDDKFCITRLIVFYPFFYLGYILNESDVSEFFNNKKLKIASAVILIGLTVAVCLNTDVFFRIRPLLSGRHAYSEFIYSYNFGELIRLAYYACAVIIGSCVICITPNRALNGKAAKLGGRTIQIYSLHCFFIYLYTAFFENGLIPNHPVISFILVSVIITAICSLKIWTPIFKALMNPFKKTRNGC